jgi:hypothetical protein
MYGTYGIIRVVRKTTIYLPEELKSRVERAARANGVSEAEVIRAAIERYTDADSRPRPKLPLFNSGRGDIAERVDEILAEGFGAD